MAQSIMQSLYGLLESLGYPHPVHPPVTHLPIGLVFGAFLFGTLSLLLRRPAMNLAARYCAITAFASLFVAVALGCLDWQHFFAGGWLLPIKIKLILAVVLLVLLAAALMLNRESACTPPRTLSLYTLSLITVLALGYFGGQLVYSGRSVPAPPEFRAGERVFRGNCSGCHPYLGNIADPDAAIWRAPQLRAFPTFLDWIRNPRLSNGKPGVMPPFPASRISDRQVKTLYDYTANVVEGGPRSQKEPAIHAIAMKTDPESIDKGRTLFEINCRDCHTAESRETIIGPGLQGILKRQQLPVSGRPATPGNVYRQLRQPYKDMPSFAGKLSDDDVLNLVAFLNAL